MSMLEANDDLARADGFAASVEALLQTGLPVFGQLGPAVVTCPSIVVSLSGFTVEEVAGCVTGREAQVTVVVARDCAIEFNDDGTTDQAAVHDVSRGFDADANDLLAWAMDHLPRPISGSRGIAVNWSVEGGLMYTVLTATIGLF